MSSNSELAKFTTTISIPIISHGDYMTCKFSMKDGGNRYRIITPFSQVSDDGKLYYFADDKLENRLVAIESLD